MPSSPEQLIKRCGTLPSLPTIYNQLTEVMHDPYSSAADFGTVVSEDMSLTARLLALVNSAFYGLPYKVDSIGQALAVVGTNQLHDLALATSVITAFRDIPNDLIDIDAFWRHSLGCGVCARSLAEERRDPNVERLFVAGLLHDVGRLVICLAAPTVAQEAIETARRDKELLHTVEERILGFDHAALGRQLLAKWDLPVGLQEPVGFHHKPHIPRRFPLETATVHVADIMAHALQLGASGERYVPPVSDEAWKALGDMDQLPLSMFDEVEQQYQAAVQTILDPSQN